MNKIKCSNCKKKFDNDQYHGICPKCGAFNRVTTAEQEDHDRYHQMYDSGNVHEQVSEARQGSPVKNAEPKRPDTLSSAEERRRKDDRALMVGTIIKWVVIIIIVLNFLVTFFGLWLF